jgi:hypothetical protein
MSHAIIPLPILDVTLGGIGGNAKLIEYAIVNFLFSGIDAEDNAATAHFTREA